MKKLIFAAFVLLTCLLLAVWGDRMLSRTLDAQLSELLTRELGLPVQLAPIDARILSLRASTAKLVMGDPNDPAIIATDVQVSLAWSDLLNRQIRLVRASADELTVELSNWPSSGKPLPDDYLFLDQWLPRNLKFNTGRYITADGGSYPLREFQWRRKFGGSAGMAWKEDRAGGEVALDASLKSLQDLLQLSPVELDITVEVAGNAASKILVHAGIQSSDTSGYTIDAQLQAAGTSAHVTATHDTPWRLPDHSTTTVGQLEPLQLLQVLKYYTGSGEDTEAKAILATAVPALSLPGHQGHMEIDEIRVGDEIVKNTTFNFTTGNDGVKVSELSSQGPTGILQGQFNLLSSGQSWQVHVDARMQARIADKSIAAHYLNADWLWRTGHIRLDGKGATWGALLNAIEGDIKLVGAHKGETETPVDITARLDQHPGEFSLEEMVIRLGEGHITGSAALLGTKERKLVLDIAATGLHLDFLFTDREGALIPGIAVPEYLDILPSVEIEGKLVVSDLQAPGVNLSQAKINLQRAPGRGLMTASAQGKGGGSMELRLDGTSPPGGLDDFILTAKLNDMDIPDFFQQEVLFASRSTGVITFQGSGRGLKEAFASLQGRAQLAIEYRRDSNWRRKSTPEEQLKFSGNANLEIENDRILGLRISRLDIDSFKQDVTGSLSLVDGRSPWLVTQLESDNLNLDGILALMPKSTAQADEQDLLSSLQQLGSMKLSLNARSLTFMNQTLSNMVLKVSSPHDVFVINQLDFLAEDSQLKSHGEISWKGKNAYFQAAVDVSNFDLDRFLIEQSPLKHVPVSGTINLTSKGSRYSQLLSNLSGRVDLKASHTSQGATQSLRRNLQMQVKQVANGVHADISKLQIGENELVGSLRYYRTSPPQMDIEIKGGTISLLPWEATLANSKKGKPADRSADSDLARAAKASADAVSNMLLSPTRIFSGPREAKPGDKYFSTQALPLNTLKTSNVNLKGRIASLKSTLIMAKDLDFVGTLKGGRLTGQASAGELNEGSAELEFNLNASGPTPTVQLETTFRGLVGSSHRHSFPRSGFASLASRGQSPAELAAHLTGTVYLELGRGNFDFRSLALLNAEVATSMFNTLIPGIEQQEPEIECGVSMATFKDGLGVTPFGFTARTDSANLLGRIELDLKKEMLKLEFDSRSRQGIGISVGSVFSNSVKIKGPLTNPQIVPATASILWRGWAAFMTAGLSVVGESVFKRALASENPCKSIKKDLRKEICGTNVPAASSPMICP